MNEIKDVVVKSYGDLLAAVRPFQPGGTSIRDEIIRGFNLVKERKEVWNKVMQEIDGATFGNHKPAAMADPDVSKFWLDQIIERRLGGRRSGISVVWVIDNKTYSFDPYTGEVCCK